MVLESIRLQRIRTKNKEINKNSLKKELKKTTLLKIYSELKIKCGISDFFFFATLSAFSASV